MTGTVNAEALAKLKEGRKLMTFPVTKDDLAAAGDCFRAAIELDSGLSFETARKDRTGYPKAWGHLGYSLLTAWLEGWQPQEVLDDAGEFTAIAIGQELGVLDYDTHWDRAAFYQVTESFDQALQEYETALDLNIDDTNLLLEASEGYVSAGRHDDALKLLDKAGRSVDHDWYRWDRAWVYYFKARQDPVFYDLAISEIRKMYWNPGEPQYMFDVQLLLAATYAKKGDQAKAEVALMLFQKSKPNWTLTDEQRARPLKLDEDRLHYLSGCAAAGLSDPDRILGSSK